MNRLLLFFLLLTFVVCLIQPIQAQQRDEQRAMLLKELEAESQYTGEILKQSEEIRQRILTLKLVKNAELDKKIKQAITDNNNTLAIEYFDAYCKILDSLMVSNPELGKKTVTKLKTLYQNIPSVWDRIYFYSGAADYFLFSYDQAEKTLYSMLEQYPQSTVRTNAITLLLKTYIVSSNQEKALAFINQNTTGFNDENNYFTGHIYFVLVQDSVSALYFNKVAEGKYYKDSQKMLSIISAFRDDPRVAIEKFKQMLVSEPQSSFLLLTLARLSIMTGKWADAEQYYNSYNKTSDQRNEVASKYELAMAYLNAGDTKKSLELLGTLLQNPNIGEFYSPALYLWSETKVKTGDVSAASVKINQVTNSVNLNIVSLPRKAELMNRVMELKKAIETNSNIDTANSIINELDNISKQLDSLNASIAAEPTGISPVQLKRWESYETQMIVSFRDMLNQFIAADKLREKPDSTSISQFDKLEKSLNDQLIGIQRVKDNLKKQAEENVALALRNQAEQNIELYEGILNSLNLLKTTGTQKYTPAELDSLILTYERQKTETNLLLDYYDYDNSLYSQVIAECDSATVDSNRLLAQIPALRQQYRDNYSQYISKIEKKLVTKDIDNLLNLVPEYQSSLMTERDNLSKLLVELDFIGIHVAFTESGYYEKQKMNLGKTLSYIENEKLFSENKARKQAVYDRITAFIAKYPNFKSGNVSKDYPVFLSSATLNYELAELSNSLWQDRPAVALDYYRKVNTLDPKFYNKDAVLYNIGYISSVIEKNRIETGLETFESTNTTSANKPQSLRFNETNYKETIDAYSSLISDYKDSPFYSEAILRLGFVYFEIGTDAEKPVEYYQIARSYYDRLANKADDPNKFQALYQRGWTWLNSSTEEAYINGMNDFVAILNAIDQGVLSDSTEAIDYTLASLKNIGYCVIGLDGANTSLESKGAKYAQLTLAPLVNKINRNKIIDEAIAQKLKLFLPMQAVDFMNVKIALDPLAIDNITIADSISTLYATYPSQIRGIISADSTYNVYINERYKIISTYGLNSEWFNANQNNLSPKHIAIFNKAFKEVEMRFNNQFIDSPTQANFDQYAKLIDQYRAFTVLHDSTYAQWDKAKLSNIVALSENLANATKNPISYMQTVKRIHTFNDAYPDNENYFNREGVAFTFASIVMDSLSTEYLAIQQQNSDPGLPATMESLTTFCNSAVDRFKGVLLSDRFKSPQNDYMYITILLKQAEQEKSRNQLDKAAEFYTTIVNFTGDISNEIMHSSYINLAEIADSTKKYSEAEKWYLSAEKYASDANSKNIDHQYALYQIQNQIDDAQSKGDNVTVARENLRLGAEYATSDKKKNLQYTLQAQTAYLAAKEYQKSIDLLILMSTSTSNPKDVLGFYYNAWSIADSVGYKQQADSLKQEFISKYPSSNESYQLRVAIINNLASNSQTYKQAGQMYLDIYQDVVDKKIDAGTDNPEELYLAAIVLYAQAGDEAKQQELSEQFIAIYPNNAKSIDMMDYLAGRYLAQGDSTKYEKFALDLYRKDKTRSAKYENLVRMKLGKVASDFQKAYLDQNWNIAFAKRDEFKKMQNSYEKEGLNLDFGPVYEQFELAETEYSEIQARIAFLKQYDAQLASFNTGFLTRRPADLIRVNVNTSWKRHLTGEKENRIQALKSLVLAETKKVNKLLESAAKYNLDTDRRLRAFDTICRLNEFGVAVIKKQVDVWMNISTEFAGYKKQFEGNEDELYGMINTQREEQTLSLLQQAAPYYMNMYKYFYIAGCVNQYTQHAYDKLVELNGLPRYRFDELTLKNDWSMSLVDIADSASVIETKLNTDETTSTRGAKLSTVSIPPNKGLIVRKTIKSKVPPEYMVSNLSSVNYLDTIVKINGEIFDFTAINAIDTLQAGKPSTTRYAMGFGNNKFTQKDNELEMRFFNYSTEPLPIAMNLIVVTDSVKIEDAVPQETVTINSDEYWQYAIKSDSTSIGPWKSSLVSEAFGFDKTQWYEMENSNSKPIWVTSEDAKDTLNVVFKKEFRLDGVFKEGYVQFIAPDIATIRINGKDVTNDNLLNYDQEANLVFAGKAYLSADILKQGSNELEIVVNNTSKWKGMVAEIIMTVTHPE